VGRLFAGDELKKVPLDGGAPITLGRISSPPRGATGARTTRSFLAIGDKGGLLRVSASGGDMSVVAKLGEDEANYSYPAFLPNRQRGSVQRRSARRGREEFAVRARSHDWANERWSAMRRTLITGGLLVYAANGAVHAIRFDRIVSKRPVAPIPIIDQVLTFSSGSSEFRRVEIRPSSTCRGPTPIHRHHARSCGSTAPGREDATKRHHAPTRRGSRPTARASRSTSAINKRHLDLGPSAVED
jgi:hypothetical protein